MENNNLIVIVCPVRFNIDIGIVTTYYECNGYSVYRPVPVKNWFGSAVYPGLNEKIQKEILEKHRENYKNVIKMASKVVVMKINGYIGKDTKKEMEFAEEHNIPIEVITESDITEYEMFIRNY